VIENLAVESYLSAGGMNMKSKSPAILVLMFGCLAVAAVYSARASVDGITPPHAVDTDGKAIPESSATQPDKPIILSKDINDPKWGELRQPKALFDHTKHNTDVMHTFDGKTLTNCVYCHHTEQPSASGGETYLKTFKRTAVLTAEQLKTSNEPVKSCRACHFQKSTPATDEYPPKSVSYPRALWKVLGRDSGALTNDIAYHLRCRDACHTPAKNRDPNLTSPIGCGDCHIDKTAKSVGTATPTPSSSSMTTQIPGTAQ
jgi:hypothetical protein